MKEFSRDEVSVTDRKFEIGGVVLEWRYPYHDELFEVLTENAQQDSATDENPRDTVEKLIRWSAVFLTPDSKEKWLEVAHRKEDPIPLFQFGRLFQWLLEEASGGRPTESPSASEPGGGKTEQSSPDGSPSTVATPTG